MDRNQIIGFTLIGVLFMVYVFFFGQEPKPQNTMAIDSTRVTLLPRRDTSNVVTISDSALSKEMQEKYGMFAAGGSGKEEELVLENKDLQITLSTKGGNVKKVLLKKYLTYDKKPLYLINEKSSKIALNISTVDNREINLDELYFTGQVNKEADRQTAVFRLPIADGKYIEQLFTLPAEGFQMDYNVKFVGLENVVKNVPATINWNTHLQKIEYDINQSRDRSTVNYYTTEEGFDNLPEASRNEETEKLETPVKWVNMKQKFFNSAIIAKNSFSAGTVSSKVTGNDSTNIKELNASVQLPYADLIAGKGNYQFFFGPNEFGVCKNVVEGFEDNVNLGWPVINLINRFVVIPVFHLLESVIFNYGIIIVILVLLLKLILLPLSYKSYVSMAKMKVMKPELDEIKAKYGDDMQKTQAEQMQLYQKVGINPLSGCIPVLLQMPILFAMFSFFPNAIELRQQPFLWSPDLSTYDAVITWKENINFFGWNLLDNHISLFTLLMTISTLVYTWFNNQMSTAVQGPMKAVSYVMPVVFMFVLNSFPAGLSFYYFVSNLVTIGQQLVIKRFVDEGALRAKLDENRKNYQSGNVKKSPFMQRLNDAMKAQEELKKNQEETKKKKK
ncbi:MAG TPA: membrane protein insertase YidC [Cytophagaceae bacterium]|nr:membrane protein insertase YidC [Cytophagaceae bacterium]